MATAVKVNIYNQSYNLRADGDGDYVKQIAEYVDSRMQEISARTNVIDYGKIAVLAALNIADELHRVRQFQEPQDNADIVAATEHSSETPQSEVQAANDAPRTDRMGWNYADIFEELPERKEGSERLSQQVISKLRQSRGDDHHRRGAGGED